MHLEEKSLRDWELELMSYYHKMNLNLVLCSLFCLVIFL